ncbi:hypothetical protein WJX73_009513 [Symbiochloris irregularis]|uniref:PROP1-like PPR domain-containing protein n=1 Tax=Symbiochloris irregularis TaxID=706552 RepID=A0AAW1NNC4_9CHLO
MKHGAELTTLAATLQDFSQQTSRGLDDLRRNVQSKPCIGPSEFKANLQDLIKQENGMHAEVSNIASSMHSTSAVQELLSKCLSTYQDNQARMASLQHHLQQYGYTAERECSAPLDPLAGYNPSANGMHLHGFNTAQPRPLSAAKQGVELRDRKHFAAEQQSHSASAPFLSGLQLGRTADDSVPISRPTSQPTLLTPSPLAASSVSMSSLSPSMRDLHRKYGRDSNASKASKDRDSLDNMLAARMTTLLHESTRLQHATPQQLLADRQTAQGKQLDYLALETPNHTSPSHAGPTRPIDIALQHLNLEVPAEGDATSEDKSASNQDSASTTDGASIDGSSGATASKKEALTAKLASGEAPWDMISLRAAINSAQPGTGEVERAVASATFHPQAAAFTALLHMCAKAKLWEKALEVFSAMKTHHSGVQPNTVHFSCLMSACATAGRWREAEQVFREMELASAADPQCCPNVISYSAVMTACCMGGHPHKAEEWFLRMRSRGISPDHICYSTLIAGFERFNSLDRARYYHEEMVKAGLAPKAMPLGQDGGLPPLGMTHLDLSAFKHQMLTPSMSKPKTPLLPTPHALASAQARMMPGMLSHPMDANMGMLDSMDTIPAHFGNGEGMGRFLGNHMGVQSDELTMDLRREMLRTRSPHVPSSAFHLGSMHTPEPAAYTPQAPAHHSQYPGGLMRTPAPMSHTFAGRAQTPSTDELLRAAAMSESAYKQGLRMDGTLAHNAHHGLPPSFQHGFQGNSHMLNQQPSLSNSRPLLSHHSAPQSMLSQLVQQEGLSQHGGDGGIIGSRPLSRDDMQGWGQHASGQLGSDLNTGSGGANSVQQGSSLLRHASAVAQMQSTSQEHLHSLQDPYFQHSMSSGMSQHSSGLSSALDWSANQANFGIGMQQMAPQVSGHSLAFDSAPLSLPQRQHSGASLASLSASQPSQEHISNFMTAPSSDAPLSQSRLGMSQAGGFNDRPSTLNPNTAPFAVAPGAELQAAKQRNGNGRGNSGMNLPDLAQQLEGTNMPPISMEEFQSLPVRFSRHLTLDALNAAQAFLQSVAASNRSQPPGVTQGDLDPLQLGPGQATALINALLHLRRLHLNVSHGVTTYIPGPASET